MSWRGRRKFGNKKVTIDGMEFDSKSEGEYYLVLKKRQEEGEISNLRMQVPYVLIPKIMGEKVKHLKTKDKLVPYVKQSEIKYIADFVYWDNFFEEEIIVDVKGCKTDVYKLKKAMMLYINGLEITEVKAASTGKKKKKDKDS